MLLYFHKSEDQERGADEYHGIGGPLKVSDLRLRRPIADCFIQAATEIGIPLNEDYNGASQEGVGYFQQTAHKGFRWSNAKEFLRPARKRPDIQFHMQPLRADKPGDGAHKFSAFTSSVCQLRPHSRGHMEIKSSDPLEYPAIHPNYLSDERDHRVAVGGVKVARRIAEATSLPPHIIDEYVPGRQFQSDEERLHAARQYSQTNNHLDLGKPPPLAVVCQDLIVNTYTG